MSGGEASALPPRALWCLLGAVLWVAPHALVRQARGAPLEALEIMALAGCGFASLALVHLAASDRGAAATGALPHAPLVLGLGLALAPSAGLGYWVAAATHHRPLGAVTFAVAAAVIGAFCVALARWSRAEERAESGRVVVRVLWLVAATALLAGLAVALRSALAHPQLGAVVGDLALGAVLALLILALPTRPWAVRVERAARVAGGLLCLLAFVLGFAHAGVRAIVKSEPGIGGIVALLLP